VRVDFPGYDASWEGIINGDVDVAFGTTVSGPTRRLEASPRGIAWLPAPHDDDVCWQRLLEIAPYFTKYNATRGAGISDENPQEAGTYPYPVLITQAQQDENTVYWLARVMTENFESYKDADPGAIGWALESQVFDWVVPYHEGAVRYWKEIGVWTDEYEAHNQDLIRRQVVLAAAWSEVTERRIRDQEEFLASWHQLRAERLRAAGFAPVWE
jgi:TRAP transporter TAXI family solute receptor